MANFKILGCQGEYKGAFVKPIFELLTDKVSIRRGMYDAFHPLGFGVGDLRFDYNLALAEQYVAVQFRRGHAKFLSERVEVNLTDFTAKDLQESPRFLETADTFLRTLSPEMEFKNHQFMYYSHVEIEGTSAGEFLSHLPAPILKFAGNSLGTGFNFLWDLPSVKWRTRLALDHSLLFANALFIVLTVETQGGKILYAPILHDIQSYLRGVLAELDLILPVE